MMWTLRDVVAATGGEVLQAEANVFTAVTIDSRQVMGGELFVAVKGANHDGHDFAAAALDKGARGVVIEKMPCTRPEAIGGAVVVVPDSLRALGDLAAFRRRQWAPTVVAITGSNGKTTTKEMVATILRRATKDGKVLCAPGNYNNLIGLPLTLLRLSSQDKVAVVEMGTNAPGEIWRLTEIASPDYGMVTNVGPAHLEGLGSIAGVAAAKGELFVRMSDRGTAIVNRDDPRVVHAVRNFSGRQVGYGQGGEVRAEGIAEKKDGRAMEFTLLADGHRRRVLLSLPGQHNVSNALAAAATAWAMGIPLDTIANAIGEFQPVAMRMEVMAWPNRITWFNDAYNANPASMDAALRTLARCGEGRKIAILGDMWELGSEAPAAHRQVGEVAGSLDLDYLFLLGRYAPDVARGAEEKGLPRHRIHIARDHQDIARRLRQLWQEGDRILLKGSRGMTMEKILSHLSEGAS